MDDIARSRFKHLDVKKDEEGRLMVAEYEGWKTGDKIRVLEDDEEEGVWEGNEGTLELEIVGSPDYGNERVSFAIVQDGVDPLEVQPDNIEAVT